MSQYGIYGYRTACLFDADGNVVSTEMLSGRDPLHISRKTTLRGSGGEKVVSQDAILSLICSDDDFIAQARAWQLEDKTCRAVLVPQSPDVGRYSQFYEAVTPVVMLPAQSSEATQEVRLRTRLKESSVYKSVKNLLRHDGWEGRTAVPSWIMTNTTGLGVVGSPTITAAGVLTVPISATGTGTVDVYIQIPFPVVGTMLKALLDVVAQHSQADGEKILIEVYESDGTTIATSGNNDISGLGVVAVTHTLSDADSYFVRLVYRASFSASATSENVQLQFPTLTADTTIATTLRY